MDNQNTMQPDPKVTIGFDYGCGQILDSMHLSQGSYLEDGEDVVLVRGEKIGDRLGPVIAIIPKRILGFACISAALQSFVGKEGMDPPVIGSGGYRDDESQ